MTLKIIVTLVYGLIIMAGGIIGYVTAKSMPSLISGGLLGLIVVIGGVMMALGKPAGQILALLATILVGAFFAVQLIKGLSAGGAVGRAAGILAISVLELFVLLLVKSPKQ